MASIYTQMIATAAACDPADAPLVEGWMRLEHGTLDGLDARQFTHEAIAAYDCVLADRAASVRLAKSYGLIK